MTIKECYEKFKHLDDLLSDRRWMADESPVHNVLNEMWEAIKENAR
jgi:hypothetical protein